MLTSIAALALASLAAYGIVSTLLWLVGRSIAGRIAVYVAAFASGLIVPWAIVDGLLALLVANGDKAA